MSIKQMNPKRWEFWKDQIKSWEESSLSQAEYCRGKSLDKRLFSKWKNRLLKVNENNLVEIPIEVKGGFSHSDDIELIIKDRYKIKVYSNFNRETLKRLIETIEG
jgi:hypothetical protein